MFLFLNLNHFSRKYDENIYHFYNIFSKFLSPCTCSQNSVIFSKKRCCSFKILTDNYLFSQFWESLVTKLMKRLTIFRTYFHTFSSWARSQNFVIWKFLLKKFRWLKMLTSYYSFLQLWATFATKDLSNFLHILKIPLHFYMSITSYYHNISLKEIPPVSIC